MSVSDGSLSAQDTFLLTINAVNDAPTIAAISPKSTNEDTALTSFGVVINDVDTTLSSCSSPTLSATSSNTLLVANATLTAGFSGTPPNCSLTFTPASNQVGTAAITVIVNDGSLGSNTTFSLTVNAVNDTPTANADSFSTNQDTAYSGNLSASDADGDALTYSKVADPSHGTVTVTGATGAFIYTPTASYTGSDSFTFTVSDGLATSTAATISIQVNAVGGGAWTNLQTTGSPSLSAGTAIWTGSKMILWGGAGGGFPTNQGALYDPVSNSWSPTTTTNAPTGRWGGHAAVWTGSKMIIWGGNDGYNPIATFKSGGLYDPATNTWTPTSTTNAPTGRGGVSAVWTGKKMIVWGGGNGSFFNSGGIYDPESDTWTATSTTNAPEARSYQSAFWTGSKMLIWGDTVTSRMLTPVGCTILKAIAGQRYPQAMLQLVVITMVLSGQEAR